MCVCALLNSRQYLHINMDDILIKFIFMHIPEVVVRTTSILHFSRRSPRAHPPPCCSRWGSPNLCPKAKKKDVPTMAMVVSTFLKKYQAIGMIIPNYMENMFQTTNQPMVDGCCQAAETKGMPCDDAVVVTQHCLSITEVQKTLEGKDTKLKNIML